MLDFIYNTPTKVYFGKGKEKEVGSIIKELGYKKIMMQYGKQSIKKTGLYETVKSSLKENDIEVIEMGGVEPNPKIDFVRNAIQVAKQENVQMILAVGGGSVIDSSKYTALGAKADCDVWEFSMGRRKPESALPVGCILTIAAAGSEMSNSAVITNQELNLKKGCTTELNRCKFAIMNPELTFSLGKYQTACGIVDIMSHTMERYFTVCPPTDLTDRIAESILKAVIDAAKVLIENPCDYNARATIMWASSLSHNGLTSCGRENALPVHQLEHALSGEYDFIAHGAGLAVLFPAWARFACKENPSRFKQFAQRVWGVTDVEEQTAAIKGIEEMEKFFKQIGMPLSLREFGLERNCIDRLSDLCTYGKTRVVKSIVNMDYEKIKDIYNSCY